MRKHFKLHHLIKVTAQLHALTILLPRERTSDTHWTDGWVGPRAVLDMVAKRKIPLVRIKLQS
jgi:hypothetical protein